MPRARIVLAAVPHLATRAPGNAPPTATRGRPTLLQPSCCLRCPSASRCRRSPGSRASSSDTTSTWLQSPVSHPVGSAPWALADHQRALQRRRRSARPARSSQQAIRRVGGTRARQAARSVRSLQQVGGRLPRSVGAHRLGRSPEQLRLERQQAADRVAVGAARDAADSTPACIGTTASHRVAEFASRTSFGERDHAARADVRLDARAGSPIDEPPAEIAITVRSGAAGHVRRRPTRVRPRRRCRRRAVRERRRRRRSATIPCRAASSRRGVSRPATSVPAASTAAASRAATSGTRSRSARKPAGISHRAPREHRASASVGVYAHRGRRRTEYTSSCSSCTARRAGSSSASNSSSRAASSADRVLVRLDRRRRHVGRQRVELFVMAGTAVLRHADGVIHRLDQRCDVDGRRLR